MEKTVLTFAIRSISIHALCEEGDLQKQPLHLCGSISIHALCEEGDHPAWYPAESPAEFLSTPSARRATVSPPVTIQTL